MPRSLVVKITCGAEAAERANQGWTVAAMGLAAGAEVTVWLTGEAVWFAVAGPAAGPGPAARDRRWPSWSRPYAGAADPGLQPVRRPAGADRGPT